MRNPNEIISAEKEKHSSEIHNERQKLKKLIIVIPITVALIFLLTMLVVISNSGLDTFEDQMHEIEELGNGVNDLLTEEVDYYNEAIKKLEADKSLFESDKALLESDLNTLNTYGGTDRRKQTITKELEDLEKNIKDLDNEIAEMTEKRNNLLNAISKSE